MPRRHRSSAGQGFGLGLGLVFGIIAAVSLLIVIPFLLACGGAGSDRVTTSTARPKPIQWTTQPSTAAGRQFLRDRLAELLAFRDAPSFRQNGFSPAGPYHQWLKSVEAARDDPSFSRRERAAAGDLTMLGLEYVSTKGQENEYTRTVLPSIRAVIDAE